MSWWFYRRDKDGKRQLWAVDFDPIISLIIVSLLFALISPGLKRNPIGFASVLVSLGGIIAVSGFACLLLSKISLFRQGIWISCGAKQMSDRNARLYRVGYALLVCGGIISWLFSRLIP